MKLSYTLLRDDAAPPRYATAGAAGLDLSAAVDEPVAIAPGSSALIPTGVAIAIPHGHEGQVRPRSGLAARHGVTVLNAPGTIDEDYRGELRVLLINHGSEPYVVRHGERIAQLVVAAYARVELASVEDVSALGETVRGSGGFGSTGA